MVRTAKHFLHDESGAASIEYAMLAAVIALALAIGAESMGQDICALFNGVGTAFMTLPPSAITPVPC